MKIQKYKVSYTRQKCKISKHLILVQAYFIGLYHSTCSVRAKNVSLTRSRRAEIHIFHCETAFEFMLHFIWRHGPNTYSDIISDDLFHSLEYN